MGWLRLQWDRLKHSIQQWRSRNRDPVPIWRTQIKLIEGHFGTGVVSFFVFTRYIFIINTAMAMLWLFLVVTPMAVAYDYGDVVQQQLLLRNLLDGRGLLQNLWFFVGGYSPTIGRYRLDLAYTFTFIASILLCFVILMRSIGRAVSVSVSTGSIVRQDTKYPFAVAVFASWDHSINSIAAVKNLRLGISNVLKDQLAELHAKARKENKAKDKDTRRILMQRIFAWCLTVLILTAACVIIFFLATSTTRTDGSDTGSSGSSTVLTDAQVDSSRKKQSFWQSYSVPIVFSLLNAGVPFFFRKMVRYEGYQTGKVDIGVTIARVFALRVLNIYTLSYAMWKQTTSSDFTMCVGTFIGQVRFFNFDSNFDFFFFNYI